MKEIKLTDVRIGSEIKVRGDFGTGKLEVGIVTDIDEDIKNGREGIEYITTEDNKKSEKWAYIEQVQGVITY